MTLVMAITNANIAPTIPTNNWIKNPQIEKNNSIVVTIIK